MSQGPNESTWVPKCASQTIITPPLVINNVGLTLANELEDKIIQSITLKIDISIDSDL